MADTVGQAWWSELMTRNPDRAVAFYERVLGWTFQELDGSTYLVASSGGRPIAGVFDMRISPEWNGTPEHWFSYVAVTNVDRAVIETQEAGGSVARAPFDVVGVGRIAVVTDPLGAAVGFIAPAAPG